MMTKLTKTARQKVMTRVLKEAFEPKFADLQKRLVQYASDWLNTNHPVFVELLARKDAVQYINHRHFYRVYINGLTAYYPDYVSTSVDSRIVVNEIIVPSHHSDYLYVDDKDLLVIYNNLWDTYRAAHSELLKILAAYRTHEALLVDFPEYATYLSAPVVKQLPAVIPAESRARLKELMK